MKKRWLKYHSDHGVQYTYTGRPMDADDRDGSDVWSHYHEKSVIAAERGECKLPPLTARDQSYAAAAAAFYPE